jgi:hypothetical protein
MFWCEPFRLASRKKAADASLNRRMRRTIMNDSQQETFKRLEEAVAQWGAEVSGAQQGLAEGLGRARERLGSAGEDLNLVARLQELRETCAAVEALRAEVAGLRRDLDDMREQLGVLPRLAESLERLTSAGLEAPAEASAARNDTWREVARLRAQLEEDGPATRVEVSEIGGLAFDSEGHRRRIGEVLQAAGVLSGEQVRRALEEQESAPLRRLGTILVEKGYAPEDVVARVLAGQLRTRFVELSKEPVDPSAVSLINARVARRHMCLPIAATDDTVTLAIVNPFDLVAIDDVELASQRRVETVVATATDIDAAIQKYYGH